MKKHFGKLAVFVLSAAVIMGSPVITYANEPDSAEGPGTDMTEKDDKIQVILPTDAVGIFDFILDPQGLINETNASAYGGKIFEEGATIFFKRSDGAVPEDYSSTSDAVTITNRGSVPVDVVITAGITVIAEDGFAMTDDKEFTDDERASLYLALTDGETEVPIMGEGEEAAELTITVPPASEMMEEDKACAFQLTGAANKEGDWLKAGDVSFQVTVTWMVIAQEEMTAPGEEEMDLSGIQAEKTDAVKDPGEKIVRKTLPVISSSDVMLETEREMPLSDKPSDSPMEKTSATKGRATDTKEELRAEDTTTMKNVPETHTP